MEGEEGNEGPKEWGKGERKEKRSTRGVDTGPGGSTCELGSIY